MSQNPNKYDQVYGPYEKEVDKEILKELVEEINKEKEYGTV